MTIYTVTASDGKRTDISMAALLQILLDKLNIPDKEITELVDLISYKIDYSRDKEKITIKKALHIGVVIGYYFARFKHKNNWNIKNESEHSGPPSPS